jgi:hypothetical protein
MILILGALALAACKKDADSQAGAGTATSAAPLPPSTGEATAASAMASVTAAPTPPPPPVAAAPVQQASIDACCSALSAVGKSGRGRDAKAKSAQASKVCPGIAKLVKEGKTTRASALTQIKSALVGVDIPSECH